VSLKGEGVVRTDIDPRLLYLLGVLRNPTDSEHFRDASRQIAVRYPGFEVYSEEGRFMVRPKVVPVTGPGASR
jgi:hypothetical protein